MEGQLGKRIIAGAAIGAAVMLSGCEGNAVTPTPEVANTPPSTPKSKPTETELQRDIRSGITQELPLLSDGFGPTSNSWALGYGYPEGWKASTSANPFAVTVNIESEKSFSKNNGTFEYPGNLSVKIRRATPVLEINEYALIYSRTEGTVALREKLNKQQPLRREITFWMNNTDTKANCPVKDPELMIVFQEKRISQISSGDNSIYLPCQLEH